MITGCCAGRVACRYGGVTTTADAVNALLVGVLQGWLIAALVVVTGLFRCQTIAP
jgi:hypothetical protein